jgi:carboxylesterase type B
VVELYRKLYPGASPSDLLISTLTDSNFRIRSMLLAERKVAQNRAPVWFYSFDWETPVHGGKLKAYHALDVPFVFNTIDNVNATDRGPVAHELFAPDVRDLGRHSRAPASRTMRRSRAGRLYARRALDDDLRSRVQRRKGLRPAKRGAALEGHRARDSSRTANQSMPD